MEVGELGRGGAIDDDSVKLSDHPVDYGAYGAEAPCAAIPSAPVCVVPEGSGPVGIDGFARPRPERAEELERLLLSFVEPTRSEPGAWQYQVHRDVSAPTTLSASAVTP
ncbi:putative quinol monooxygenase [Streptomyces sp. NPDC013187]|uniref:putative quinol monooxygenase n=1 Tax=Streptomyces sp. NPDC013187 TaxID=3364865 RepID=UPI00369D6ADE